MTINNIDDWLLVFENSVKETTKFLQEEYLDFLNLTAVREFNHPFSGPEKKWYGSYLRERNLLPQKIICFALNTPLIYKGTVMLGKATDPENISMQATVLTAHEIGHGLTDYLREMKNPEIERITPLSRNEEKLVEEFGKSFAPEFTKIEQSTLRNILDKMKKTP